MTSTTSLEEDSGVIKSGPVVAGFAPIRALELHESEKTYRKRKNARHLIDLSIAFNLHNDHFDPKLKRCVCLMGPDETLCLKVDDVGKGADEGRQNTEWYNAIMSALIPSRVLRLGRPIQPQEFFVVIIVCTSYVAHFTCPSSRKSWMELPSRIQLINVFSECAWDVDVVTVPKLKKPVRSDESLQNICVRLPEIAGAKRYSSRLSQKMYLSYSHKEDHPSSTNFRLCFYAHTIVVCKRRIEPATYGIPSSGIPPFHTDDFVEIPQYYVVISFVLQRKCVAFFGCQERYFLMRLGRGAPMGASELWAQCDSEDVCLLCIC
ncbi:unnamed protein product [Heligmosomoides polygyrus]|uniref:Pkinase_fungal domain-containing protein n=1 Tax=Heligmosomoides polygyrus TaxID=6339 RepID=A0A183G008_HELPZ|nr:unnamed protein product [Heligmosomoides polygyrus]